VEERWKQKKREFKWLKLFQPEDSGPLTGCRIYKMPRVEREGCFKIWVWIIISIGIALALGQL
jgi:hypothetical protein